MTNELIHLKRVFTVIVNQCHTGITFEDLKRETDYSDKIISDCVTTLQLVGLVKVASQSLTNAVYSPTQEAIKMVAATWQI